MSSQTHSHVFYTDRSNGWVSQSRDADGNQIDEAAYYYRKADAVSDAVSQGFPVSVYGVNGLLQRKI